ncbi:hypothetical protein BDV12DRAFT_139265 [Aspergillus spectabilis]
MNRRPAHDLPSVSSSFRLLLCSSPFSLANNCPSRLRWIQRRPPSQPLARPRCPKANSRSLFVHFSTWGPRLSLTLPVYGFQPCGSRQFRLHHEKLHPAFPSVLSMDSRPRLRVPC